MIDWKSATASVGSDLQQPVYTLVGNEFTLIEQFIRTVRRQVERETQSSVEVHRFFYEESGCDSAIAECQTVSLFADKSIVILANCTALTAQAKGKHDLGILEKYLESIVDEHILIITSYAEKLDERKKVSKLLKRFPIVNCNTPKEAEALELVADLAASRNLSVNGSAMTELWRRTQSLTLAEQELDKLLAYTDGVVSLTDIQEVTPLPTEDNVFRWIEGVLAGKLSLSFQALQDIQHSGYDAFALFSLIARQIRIVWYTKVLGTQGLGQREIAKRVGVHPYAVKMAAQQARGQSAQKLEEMLCVIADTEFMVKSGRQDVGQALDWIVLSCARTASTTG